MHKGIIKKGAYYDSVTLMLAAKKINAMPGVEEASVMMATRENLAILQNATMLPGGLENAGDSDLLIVVKASAEKDCDNAIKAVDGILSEIRSQKKQQSQLSPKSLESALQLVPDANLVLISVAGKYAAALARQALEKNLHVMLFSDNVSIDDELALKKMAHKKGLLMMGPDCGTAIINGIPLAFANVVERGNIGLVGASGTGLQEVSSIISSQGGGVSQLIGTGGRDLHPEIGGIMFVDALKALASDENTKVICLVSKPPHPTVLKKIGSEIKQVKKPVVAVFIGAGEVMQDDTGLIAAGSLEEAALLSIALVNNENPEVVKENLEQRNRKIKELAQQLAGNISGKYLRGLFSGGTLCNEAQSVLNKNGTAIHSNALLHNSRKTESYDKNQMHTLVDMGADEFTVGRPHPMIDFTLRNKQITMEAKDENVAMILLDVVTGYGAHPQPAVELVPAIEEARKISPKLLFVSSITGTKQDSQNPEKVKTALENAGVIVMPSMAAAAALCSEIIKITGK
jgi:FdrA protein